MKLAKLKKKIVGKELMSIVHLSLEDYELKERFAKLVGEEGTNVDNVQLMLFKDSIFVAFVDMDCDGYRSGNWYVVDLKNWLDTGKTKEIKNINSVVKEIEYLEKGDERFLLITTKEYVIKMGQDGSDSYYPHNFFSVEELKEMIKLEGEIVEVK